MIDASASSTVKEFAERHKVSRQSVYNEINAGRLRSFKVGKSRRIAFQAEIDWISQREAEAAAA